MDLSQWFIDQLKSSADGFVWAVEQVPADRRSVTPPSPLGEWNAARHVFHMFYYEQMIALPSIRQWLGEQFTLAEEDYQLFRATMLLALHLYSSIATFRVLHIYRYMIDVT